MSGANTLAAEMVSDAISKADVSNTMDADSMALAVLSQVLRHLSSYRSRADIESYIDFELDNVVEQDLVITRGC